MPHKKGPPRRTGSSREDPSGRKNSSVLDGQGWYWWRKPWAQTRGHLLELMYTYNVVIRDLMMVDSPYWNNHIYACDNVHVTGVSIQAPPDAPN